MEEEVVKEVPVTEEPKAEEIVIESEPKPGEKTDSAKLLESLQKEREKRRLVEEELKALKTPNGEDIVSDEGKMLHGEIIALKEKLSAKEKQESLSALETQFPALRDKAIEFEEFLAENTGMRIDTAAKAFLIEKDLLPTQPRKGLEKPSGGGRTPIKEGFTAEEVDNLRINNYPEYSKRIRNGTLKIS